MELNGLVQTFFSAARALETGIKTSGLTSNGLKKLDFKVGTRTFTTLQQNEDKLTAGGMLAKSGHKVFVVKDVDANELLGTVDLTDNSFNQFGPTIRPIPIEEINAALRASPMSSNGK
jgi:hypothetical protein